MKSLLGVCIFCTTTCILLPTLNGQNKTDIPTDHRYFLWHLFSKYGHNGIISFEGFEHLLENLGIGGIKFDTSHTFVQHKNTDGSFQELHDSLKVHDHFHKRFVREANKMKKRNKTNDKDLDLIMKMEDDHDETMKGFYYEASDKIPTKCLSAQELLIAYGLKPDHGLSLSPISFLHICPAIIFELDQKSCANQSIFNGLKNERHSSSYRGDTAMLWVYASLTIFVISVAGLLGIAVVPLLQKSFFTQLLNFLVALAVGTLSGDALLHLLPHALKSDTNDEIEIVLKAGVVFLTIICFFFMEAVLRATRKDEDEEPVNSKGQYSIVDIQTTEKGSSVAIEKPKETHTHSHKPIEGSSISSVAFMVIMGDGMHNLTDGLAIGAAFSGGLVPGVATSLAVFTHELPHELGDFAVLLKSGMTIKQAMFYNIVSSVLSFIGMVGGLLLGNFNSATQWIYAATAGSFIYIALADLIPEMNKSAKTGDRELFNVFLQLVGVLCGGGIMCLIAIFEDDLHNLIG